jgi:hypothetical protein
MYRWLRNIHLILGTFSFLFLMMYAVSAVQMAHNRWFSSKPTVTEIELAVGAGQTPRAAAQALMQQHGMRGELGGVKQSPEGSSFRITRPGTVYEVVYNQAAGKAKVRTNTANFILDHADVSAAARNRLADALAATGGGAAGVRRMISVEYAYGLGAIGDRPIGTLLAPNGFAHAFNLVSPFVFNRRATLNAIGDLTAELQELAANREFEKLASRQRPADKRPGMKNFAGKLLLLQGFGYDKVTRSYWNAQDERAALLARVKQSLGT